MANKVHTYSVTAIRSGKTLETVTVRFYVFISVAKEKLKEQYGSDIKFQVQDITEPTRAGKAMQSRLDSLLIESRA